MAFRINTTDSSSPTIQIFYGKKYVIKAWLAGRKDAIAGALSYEVDVYANIKKKILTPYPGAPFIRYKSTGTTLVSNLLEKCRKTLGENWTKNHEKWFLGAFKYILENKSIPGKERCIDKYRRVLEHDDFSKIILLGTPIKFLQTYDCGDCTTFYDVLKSGSKQQIAWAIINIVYGIFFMHINKVAHNDLHHKNILLRKNYSSFHIFDFDRAYQDPHRNPMLSRDPFSGNCKASQCNIFTPFPTDLYKMLFYVFTTEHHSYPGVNAKIICKLFGVDFREKGMLSRYYKKYGSFFCEQNSKGGCVNTVLQYPNEDTKTMMKIIGTDIGKIKQKITKNFFTLFVKDKKIRELFMKRLDRISKPHDEEKKVPDIAMIEKQKKEAEMEAQNLSKQNAKLQAVIRLEKESRSVRNVSINNPLSEKKERDVPSTKPVKIYEDKSTVVYNVSGKKDAKFDAHAPEVVKERFSKIRKYVENTGFSFSRKSAVFGRTILPPSVYQIEGIVKPVKVIDIRPKNVQIKSYSSLADIFQQAERMKKYPKIRPQFYKKNERGYSNINYTYDFNTKFLAIFI